MKNPKWLCAECRQSFTRKWNAYRHCNYKHSGIIEYIVSFTEYRINEKNSSLLNLSYSENKNGPPINITKQLNFDN